jgi:phosphoglycolate phosphatase
MKHVVFDFDGTIADSKQVFIEVYNELAARHGFRPMREDDVEALRGMSIPERLRAMQVPVYRLPTLVFEFTRAYKPRVDRLPFCDGIPELLEQLQSRGLRLHVLSSNAEDNILRFLSLHRIESMESVLSARSIFGKNRTLARFLRTQRARPEDVLYVGDEERDVLACQENRVRVAAVAWGFESVARLEAVRPDYLVHHPRELVPIVEALRSG